MVQFEKNKEFDSFTLTIDGDRSEYVEMMKSILHYMSSINDDLEYPKERYYMCRLLDNMLPDHTQIVSKADAALLQQLKLTKGGAQ